jgi:ATP-dependent DNA helicase Q4
MLSQEKPHQPRRDASSFLAEQKSQKVSFAALAMSVPKSVPPPKKPEPSRGNGNFIRLNMKNNAGSCRGAKKKSKWGQRKEEYAQRKRMQPRRPRPQTFDPVDDYLDGAFHGVTKEKQEKTKDGNVPCCGGHQRPCKLLIVKKAGANKGRKFYACSMPRGEQCDCFEWADNSAAAAKEALLKKSSYSGFVARQVSSYVERFRMLTVPELRKEATKRGLNHNGKKQELLMRLSLFVRDELAGAGNDNEEEMAEYKEVAVVDDDSSTSSVELEICGDGDDFEDELSVESKNSDDIDSVVEGHDTIDTCNDDDDGASPVKRQLQQLFGHSNFREGQEWAIERCMSQKRSLLVAPTGFGKSLCYALPASMLEGTCIVVSPLISLIEDQLRQLPPKIPAATLSGGMSASAMACTIDDVLKGRIKILFVSPERLTTPSFRRLFKLKWNKEKQVMERPFPPVSLLCIDEAHCMSQWAHNFRPSYLRLRSLLECVDPLSVLAVTATAGPPIVNDICRYLEIPFEPETVSGCFVGVKILKSDRDNIDVFCKVMDNADSRLLLAQQLLLEPPKTSRFVDLDQPIHDGCLAKGNVIVYVWRQRDAEVVAEVLTASGVEGGIVVYHGGMESKARSTAQSRFLRGKARICVATVAFGMGINKIDIDAVVHMNLPSSLEHYLQEIGRAGRDGRPARAISLPIQDELVLRHSLAHSDLISQSQVMVLLRMVEAQLEQVRKDVDFGDSRADQLRVFVGVPVSKAVAALDCKVETIETLLSLMEGDEVCGPFLRFEGRVNDVVTVVLKRTTLQQLEVREQVARCISKCGRVVENTGTEGDNLSNAVRKASSRTYGFGTYEFSVSRCTNLMGPSAEPRHVYAALRRLQSLGELELVFDAGGYALQLHVDANGLGDSNGTHGVCALSTNLWSHFSNQILNTATKVKTIDAIIREVASTEHSKTAEGGKSARLVKFQQLAAKELSKCEDTMSGTLEEDVLPVAMPKASLKELMYDAQSVLHHLRDTIKHSTTAEGDKNIVRFDDEDFMDYTSLTVAKFLHGLVTQRTSSFSKHNTLFGKWRHVDFEATRIRVHESLKGQ